VSEALDRVLRALSVELVVVRYRHVPPLSWTAWRNQFFLFDVIEDLVRRSDDTDLATVMDSDVVWNFAQPSEAMWQRMSRGGLLRYDVGYRPDHVVNGLSPTMLTKLAMEGGILPQAQGCPVSYIGGEFVGGRIVRLAALLEVCDDYWTRLLGLDGGGTCGSFEEAHLLSLAYAGLGTHVGNANSYIRRLWTQPLKPRNVRDADLDLLLWHVPAEKRYGLRRLFEKYVKVGSSEMVMAMSPSSFQRTVPRMLGIPRNGPRKVVADVAGALVNRVREEVTR